MEREKELEFIISTTHFQFPDLNTGQINDLAEDVAALS